MNHFKLPAQEIVPALLTAYESADITAGTRYEFG